MLDSCCSNRAFWFNKKDPRAIYVDKRKETIVLTDRVMEISPDIQADFTNLPFPDNTFTIVVFDPPHVIREEARGYITKRYGVLNGDWRTMLKDGFSECFRVLKPNGTLIFKWSDSNVPVAEILALTPEKPLFGHKSGKLSLTHWIAFLKS